MPTLFLDVETYSTAPINAGTHRYAEGSEIMLVAYAVDDGPVRVDDCSYGGHKLRAGDYRSLLEEADAVVIHNSHFDRTLLRHHGVDIPTHRIRDTMVTALAHSLPGSLDKLCEIFQVPVDLAKSKDGKRLIQLFCKPRPAGSKIARATLETHPKDWAAFVEYAKLDIEAMRVLDRKMPRWNLIEAERRLWHLDQAINDRGVAIDMDLVNVALARIASTKKELDARTEDLTYGMVGSATQRDALIEFLNEAYDLKLPDLKGVTVEGTLAGVDLDPGLRELLAVRLAASTTSTAKYKALAKSTSSDSRLRGTLQFCGASRTGRWAGRLWQPQNLPRPDLPNEVIDEGIAALKDGSYDELANGSVMELTSNAIRGCIAAPPGKKLVVADLSNIEGRVLAWLAGEQWKLDAFAAFDRGEGHDLYKLTAGRVIGKLPDEITKAERQSFGKVTELSMGYEGGVGAFLTFAEAYGIDLDDMAVKALPALSREIVQEATGAWDWSKRQKRPTYGLAQQTWIACDGVKRAWRTAHPKTVALWENYEDAAKLVVQAGGTLVKIVGKVIFRRDAAWLRAVLPGGRSLCYPSPRIEDGKLTYMGINQYSRKWERLKTYGGKLVENVTQAVARDVLAHGMLEADPAGYRIVLTVHDEIIAECPDNDQFTADGLASFMACCPEWAKGLPLAAAGFETYRYRKE